MPIATSVLEPVRRVAILAACAGLSACVPPAEFLQHPFKGPSIAGDQLSPNVAPKVRSVVDHIRCELATEYSAATSNPPAESSDTFKHQAAARKALWKHLADDHYIAAVSLQLDVNHAEAINPTVSWISPLDYLGHHLTINPPLAPTTATPNPGQPSASFNRTLAVGLQVSGSQDDRVTLNYSVDLHELVQEVQKDGLIANVCVKTAASGLESLQGELGLARVIDDGLGGLNEATTEYHPQSVQEILSDAFGAPEAHTAPAVNTTPAPSNITDYSAFFAASTPKGGAKGAPSGGSGGSDQTSFSVNIDFGVTMGVNGGPTITELRRKIQGGTAAGGQLASFTRTTDDSLIVTFAATCQGDDDQVFKLSNGSVVLSGTGLGPIELGPLAVGAGSVRVWIPAIGTNPLKSTEASRRVDSVKAEVEFRPAGGEAIPVFGTSDLSGFVNRTSVGNTLLLTGSIQDPLRPDASVGTLSMVVGPMAVPPVNSTASAQPGAYASVAFATPLAPPKGPKNYWSKLPYCSTTTDLERQKIGANAALQNYLLRLPRALQGIP